MKLSDPDGLLQRLWSELAQFRTGMLGFADGDQAHAHPMTAHFEGEHGPLWFYAHRDSATVQRADAPHPAVFHYVSRGHELYACIHGEIRAVEDEDAVNRLWSEEVARWYPAGQTDPDVALLRFDLSSAQIWAPSEGPSATLFGLERARPADIHAEVRL